ncbi:diguanylate cyclase domain-containing protein [Magnetococcales bacterium HHB-1]
MSPSAKVLVIDDNPADSRHIVRLTERVRTCAITCHVSQNSQEGKQAIIEFQPDVVFVDYLLGKDTGLDLIQSIPKKERQERAFILLTGQGDEDVAAASLRAGMLDYLTKDKLSTKKLEHVLRFALQKLADWRALRYRDAILQAIAVFAESVFTSDSWRKEIVNALTALGQSAQASRAILYKVIPTNPQDDLILRQLYEWVATGIAPTMEHPNLQELHFKKIGCQHWSETLQAGRPYQAILSDIGKEEAAIFQHKKSQSLVLMPIFVEGNLWGVLELDDSQCERRWSSMELDALHTAANTLGAAIEREQMEQLMRLQSTAIETVADAIFITDSDGIFLWTNPAFTRMTGYTQKDIQGKTPRILKSGRQDSSSYEELWKSIKAGQVWRGEMVGRHKDGTLYIHETAISPIRDHSGKITNFVSVQHDIMLRKELEKNLRSQAELDQLTGLPNRRLFEDRLIQSIALSNRNQTHMVLIFIDLDHFKAVNDTLGHDAGDELLQEAAQRITSCVRRSDTVARLGGDEFVVILPEVTQPALAELVAKKILQQLEKPFYPASQEAHISGSIGIAVFPEDGQDCESLIKSADTAMYRSKKAGRAAFSFFNSTLIRGKSNG